MFAMSSGTNTVRTASPRQPTSTIATSKTKKGRQRRSKGIRSTKVEGVSPISKYLLKEEKGTETPQTRDLAADSLQPSPSCPTESKCDATNTFSDTLVTPTPAADTLEGSGRTDHKPNPPKAVKGAKKGGKQSAAKKKEEGRSGSKNDVTSSRRQQSGNRSRGGLRGRRLVDTQDDEYVYSRPQVQMSIRDHFPVRRSGRKSKSEIEKEAFEKTAQRLRTKDESGLKVVEVEGKGRGVISTRLFSRGELVCEYSGELISHEEAKRREKEYGKDSSIGCYMYYFTYKTSKLCVDATADNGRKGRLLNHSRTSANVVTKLLEVDDRPYLCLIAARDINVGEELEYDYGERDKETLVSHPWLAT